MTQQEFGIFAKALRTFFPKDNLLPSAEAVSLWYSMLSDIPYKTAEAALRKLVAVSKWPPTIAEIREAATGITVKESDWSEAWESARKAVRRFGSYNEEEALASMDEVTRETVKRIGYYDICMMENPDVTSAHFRDIYNQISKRQAEEARLPEAVRSAIRQIQEINHQSLLEGA